jgi:hypothetical protein
LESEYNIHIFEKTRKLNKQSEIGVITTNDHWLKANFSHLVSATQLL